MATTTKKTTNLKPAKPAKAVGKASTKPAAKAPAKPAAPKAAAKPMAAKKPKKAMPTHDQIAARAHEIAHSGTGGSDTDNWCRAERELKGA